MSDQHDNRLVWVRTDEAVATRDDVAAIKLSSKNQGSDEEYKGNPLHIDLSTISYPQYKPKWVKVRAVLDDRDLMFYDATKPPFVPTDPKHKPAIVGLQGLMYYSDSQLDWICQPQQAIDKNLERKRVLTFYIKRVKGKSMPINLVLLPSKKFMNKVGLETPILIDPKIKNDG